MHPHTLQRNPYIALGLQRNPFVLESDSLLPDQLWIDRGWSVAPRPHDKRLVQLIGVRGAGKTTHLRHWQSQTGGPYCYYPPGWGRVKIPPAGAKALRSPAEILYWDEGDRIPYPLLLSAFIRAAQQHQTIAVGTHKSLSNAAKIAGLRVSTVYIQPFDSRLLQIWAQQRIEAVVLSARGCRLRLLDEEAKRIAIAAQGSWRDAADELHIWAAQQANLA